MADNRDRDEFTYYLVESALKLTAEVTETIGLPGGETKREVGTVSIDLVHRADPEHRRTLALSGKGATWNVSARSDGALASVSNSPGSQGAAAISIGVNVLRVAAGVAKTIAAGRAAGAQPMRSIQNHEERDAIAASLREAKELVDSQRAKLHELRSSIVASADSSIPAAGQVDELVALSKIEGVLECSLKAAEAEVARLAAILNLQATKGQSKVTYTIERVVPIKELTLLSEDEPIPGLLQDGDLIQNEFDLFVRRVDPVVVLDTHAPARSYIEWREPRQVEIVVAREHQPDASYLLKRFSVPVVDEFSVPRFFVFDEEGRMRSEDVTASFGELGQLQSLGLERESTVSAIAASFGEATPALMQTLGDLGGALSTTAPDGPTEAQLAQAALDAEIALAKSSLELAGLHATSADFAELRRLEQAAAIAKARGAVGSGG